MERAALYSDLSGVLLAEVKRPWGQSIIDKRFMKKKFID